MDLKVIEKSRKLLIQVMGQQDFDKFIEDGKIEIVHKDIVYELDQDARVHNKTKNQSYCIEPICSDNLPIHDQLAIKYGYLKHKIERVEEVANKRNLGNYERPLSTNTITIRAPGGQNIAIHYPEQIHSQRLNYLDYVAHLESQGLVRKQICISEHNTNLVVIKDLPMRTSGSVICIRCPQAQLISFMGKDTIPADSDERISHCLRAVISDEYNNEIPYNTEIRLLKIRPSSAIIPLGNIYYGDINLTRNINKETPTLYKLDSQMYRFPKRVELHDEDRLDFHIINCERNICANNIRLNLECDLWTY